MVVGGLVALVGGIAAEAQTPTGPPVAAKASPGVPGCPIPTRFVPAFLAAARESGVPLSLLVAVAYEESRMNPKARSEAGAEGLLQVMPGTASELRIDTARPRANVLAGANYLARMLARFGDDRSLALAAYNAGPTAVTRAGGAPSLETLTYVANVEARTARLADCDAR